MTKKSSDALKELVKATYGNIALRSMNKDSVSCCGSTGCCDTLPSKQGDYTFSMAESYDSMEGYLPDADLHLGCGIPVEFAELKPGQHVLDLGSGAGNDVFVARSVVGETGHVTGVDFSEAMIEKALRNVEKTGFKNISFAHGDIEQLPLDDQKFDVVLSNCVLNLVPDKKTAFSEIFRVLKPGGHFSISDIVLEGTIPEPLIKAAEAYVECVSGALQKNDYLEIIHQAGFKDIIIQQEHNVPVSQALIDNISKKAGSKPTLSDTQFNILRITLTANKS